MAESSPGQKLKSAILLTLVMLVGWGLCFFPAHSFRGMSGVGWMSLAAVSCLIPGWIVVCLSGVSILRDEASVMMVQTMVRLLAVASVALAIRSLRPELGFVDFFAWLILFYLLAMAVEVCLLRKNAAMRSGK
ncbi:MAG: hypothetical protein ACK58L_21860 [Planctomycetota bacterium]